MKWLSFIANKSIKLIIALAFFMWTIGVRANPIAPDLPEFFVSELMFDSSGEWIIKLESISFDFLETVDSVRISTSSGSAKWENAKNYNFILRNNSLDSDLVILQKGDFVRVTTYYNESWGYNVTYTLIFGDYPEATVRSPKEGEAIVLVPDFIIVIVEYPHLGYGEKSIYSKLYAIATINESEERNVCTGKIKATIHNSINQPFSESRFQLNDKRYSTIFDMEQQKDGVYEGNVYACYYSIDKLYPWVSEYNIYQYPIFRRDYWTIDPIQFEMEQDSIIYLDIYLGEYVNTETVKKEEKHVLKIYPNPVVENSFYYETALPVKSTNGIIEITGLNGQKIGHYPVSENKGNITLPSGILRGIYTVSLIVNRKNYATMKIIVP